MRLSSEAIREFKEIYQEEFGEELANPELEATALRLLRLFRLLVDVPEHRSSSPVVNDIPGGTHKSGEVR